MATNQNDTPGHAGDAEKPGCWVFECPICEKTVRPEETENHLKGHAEALREAEILIDEIMRGEVNPEDEAEKWLRAFAPQFLRPNGASCYDTTRDRANDDETFYSTMGRILSATGDDSNTNP